MDVRASDRLVDASDDSRTSTTGCFAPRVTVSLLRGNGVRLRAAVHAGIYRHTRPRVGRQVEGILRRGARDGSGRDSHVFLRGKGGWRLWQVSCRRAVEGESEIRQVAREELHQA